MARPPKTTWWPATVWLLGTAGFLAYSAAARLLFGFFRHRRRRVTDAALLARTAGLARRLRLLRPVRVLEADGLAGPVSFGWVRPAICLPVGFGAHFTPRQQEAMLAHELAHLAARDPVWQGFADVLSALLWWHPLAWWACRQFRAACETAADEASLLVEAGPETLAECLVSLGQQLTRRTAPGWLGIRGYGFKSGLGKRVTRLMELRGQPWRPLGGAGCGLGRALFVLLLAGLVLGGLGWLQARGAAPQAVPSWRQSLAGRLVVAWQQADTVIPGRNPPADSTTGAIPVPSDKDRTTRLIQEGRALIESGRFSEAKEKFEQALALSPGSQAASSYLELVRGRLASELDRRATVLRGIVLDTVSFADRPLPEVLQALEEQAHRKSPAGERLKFLLAADGGIALQKVKIRIQPPLTNVTLLRAVEAVVTSASMPMPAWGIQGDRPVESFPVPLTYRLEASGVVISAGEQPGPGLRLRTFKVDANTLRFGLARLEPTLSNSGPLGVPRFVPASTNREASGVFPPSPGATNGGGGGAYGGYGGGYGGYGGGGYGGGVPLVDEKELLRQFLARDGLKLDPPKALFWNDRNGLLAVRATQGELDEIERLLQVVNQAPQQVTIQVKFCEIRRPEGQVLDLNALLGGGLTNPVLQARQPEATNATQATATCILRDAEFKAVLRRLERREGYNLMTAPSVTTLNGRQTQLKVVDVRYVVTGLSVATNPATGQDPTRSGQTAVFQPIAEPVEVGPILDVVPSVLADGKTIQMAVIATVKEFIGYDDAKGFEASLRTGTAKTLTTPTPLPRFRVRQAATATSVRDGRTLVLYGGTCVDVQRVKDLVGSKLDAVTGKLIDQYAYSTNRMRNDLLVFITPTIIDPAGNRVHTEEELK
jgi:hypothetical protein